jgi:hypothetical protein
MIFEGSLDIFFRIENMNMKAAKIKVEMKNKSTSVIFFRLIDFLWFRAGFPGSNCPVCNFPTTANYSPVLIVNYQQLVISKSYFQTLPILFPYLPMAVQ